MHFQGPAAAVDMPGLRKPESPVKEFDKVSLFVLEPDQNKNILSLFHDQNKIMWIFREPNDSTIFKSKF